MNKTSVAIIIAGLLIGVGFFVVGKFSTNTGGGNIKKNESQKEQIKNVEIVDGVQYITINARGGYSPKVSNAKAGIPTKLVFKTDGTYDCSSALSIRSINYQKVLPKTGEEIIDIGTPESGTPLKGTCGMGMYSFSVNFN